MQLVLFGQSDNTSAIDVKRDGSVLEGKLSFIMLGSTISPKLDQGSYIISNTKSVSKKIGALICSMKIIFLEVTFYLYISTIQPCMEYCCHVWAEGPSCFFKLLPKLQKQICRTAGPLLAASLQPLAHHGNVASLIFVYRYYLGRYLSELAQLVLLLKEGLLVIVIDCMIFMSPFLYVTRMSMSAVSSHQQLDSGIICL